MRISLVIFVILLLSGCGGGAPAQTSPPQPVPTTPRIPPLFCFYGVVGRQLEETAEFLGGNPCGAIWHCDWGDWNTPEGREAIAQALIAQLSEARTRGIGKAIIAVGFTLFDHAYRYRGTTELVALRTRLSILGLTDMVVALSLVDEPDMAGLSDPLMVTALGGARAAWPGVKLAAIYGDHGTPGADQLDWIGVDAYPLGAGVLERLPQLHPGQRLILVIGGGSPWMTPPERFVEYARTHDVAALVCFQWFDRPADEQGIPRAGIRSNGMAAAYRAAAKELTSA